MPTWVRSLMLILTAAALVPFACVARSRVVNSSIPRVHLVQDMDHQTSYKSQQVHPGFADGRAMRPPVDGTVAFGHLNEDDHYYRGLEGDDYAAGFPADYRVTAESIQRGRERYDIFCLPCHGQAGFGDGMVSRRADATQQSTWVPPTSMHDTLTLSRSDGHLFNTITNGIRTMPAYGRQVPVDDRWAIVSYVRALQRSQRATLDDVPRESRSELPR